MTDKGRLAAANEAVRAAPVEALAIATNRSERDPVAAANLALEIPAGKPQSDALVGIVQRWVQTAPQAAASWVASFPEGALREAAIPWVGSRIETTRGGVLSMPRRFPRHIRGFGR